MDYLWTPWRYAYVTAGEKNAGCIFCDLPKLGDDVKARIVYRGQRLLHRPEHLSLHAGARHGRTLRASR